MNNRPRQPRESLNKAFLKVKVSRSDIKQFKANFLHLLEHINEKESEEFHKNLMADFLKNTYYSPNYFINTKERNDLVIHNQKESKSSVGIILEVKKPKNQAEMVKADNLNAKALQELVLYFLRERITHKNLEVKYLIITNIYEWFIFDAQTFEKYFCPNKQLIQQFEDFEAGRLTGKTTDFFYKEIAKPAIEAIKHELGFTYFDIRDYEQFVRTDNPENDEKLLALFKLLSPQHLLKLSIANDSNTLDKSFYSELLYIIGLTETKEKNKKLIKRQPEDKQMAGSLIENAILQLDSLDKISRLENPEQFGETEPEQLFNIALELSITWMNRILFLKLLESQMMSYHKSERNFAFLNSDKIYDFGDLDRLFFQVLAVNSKERKPDLKEVFTHIPYLNSSLFEPTELEHQTIVISNLREEKLPIFSSTVLKDANGKKRTGELNTLQYLFEFLDAYDFSSEGLEGIQDEQKTLINASVLGLIFEKINGYKDGSYFTPGFITMYMCRETLRKAVVQKFNEIKGWSCQTLDDLYDNIEDKTEANQIINRLKICDPAVGSGHFLVSALNELIAIKHDLKILQDQKGRRLKEYQIVVENDELIITDEDNQPFTYTPQNRESQRIQETLFHEKQTVIENCLFGVDINPNSVKICRLRLWIELLKNSYYKADTNYTELETLPNIDINIKCGNSLISRFPLDTDLKPALKKNKIDIETYQNAVETYHHAENKQQKREMEKLMNTIKGNFKTTLQGTDPKKTKLRQLEGEVYSLENQLLLFKETKAEQKTRKNKITKLNNEIDQLRVEVEEIESGKIYENAFEWRFEFPEVLDDTGKFIGFDVVIGNPPYIRQEEIKSQKPYLQTHFRTYSGTADLYVFFVEKSFEILRGFGNFCYIMPNKWMQAGYGKFLRSFFLEHQLQTIIDFGDLQVFDEATTYPCIINASKQNNKINFISATLQTLKYKNEFSEYLKTISSPIAIDHLNDQSWVISSDDDQKLLSKIKIKCSSLAEYIDGEAYYGIKTGLTEAFVISHEKYIDLIREDNRSAEIIRPFILGRNIKSYVSPGVEKYLIKIDKGFTNFRKENKQSWNWLYTHYPAISKYLITFKEQAEKRSDQGDYWWELRACDYYQKFEKPKIMYQKFQVKPCFIYDEQGLYCNDSMWIISKSDKVLLAILNSKMGWWLISKYCTAIQNGYQLIWKYFGQVPIPNITGKQAKPIISIVDQILTTKKSNPNADTTILEQQIDQLVYELYGLTEEEIKLLRG